ncbi:MAG: DUF72 domain-containing protein [Planctomycetota bacterium]|nr:MAG: DUF72 domain-containing protein [Planctomycetota bacterium]
MSGEVRYGTAGWSFSDWYGPFYPTAPDDEGPGALFSGRLVEPPNPDLALARRRPLIYYARWFDFVEANVSFYRTPSPRTSEAWLRDTCRSEGPSFLFSVKAPRRFTHEGVFTDSEVAAFRAFVEPLRASGRLAAVLAQFSGSFGWGPWARERLLRVREVLAGLPLVVEVRERSWAEPEAVSFVRALEASLASVDQPQGRSTLRPCEELTCPALAYVRLHGRNAAAWFDARAGRDRKYDYLYAEDELREWGRRIEGFAARAERTLVVANNHFRGQAPANALELRALREPVRVPAPLARAYPRLRGLAEEA